MLTKTDLLPYVPFDADLAKENARRVHPGMEIIEVSSLKGGMGMDRWMEWLAAKQKKSVRSELPNVAVSYCTQFRSRGCPPFLNCHPERRRAAFACRSRRICGPPAVEGSGRVRRTTDPPRRAEALQDDNSNRVCPKSSPYDQKARLSSGLPTKLFQSTSETKENYRLLVAACSPCCAVRRALLRWAIIFLALSASSFALGSRSSAFCTSDRSRRGPSGLRPVRTRRRRFRLDVGLIQSLFSTRSASVKGIFCSSRNLRNSCISCRRLRKSCATLWFTT